MTLALATGCSAHSRSYPATVEGAGVCDHYGRYGPRSSYYYAPGNNYGRPQGPNDYPYHGRGATLGYGGGTVYGPMPPGTCPRGR